ncbi:hypothetical protein AYI68_g4429 [Smittium mucronatum]|uniref:Uncharacterized protein n=1 Tax=Smittium mucronatum TaxID=133383 RepID=A0A1R0GX39_9FUNG|nr:hypothetical protein AYI68_g4429 [Smittium mucronatum]
MRDSKMRIRNCNKEKVLSDEFENFDAEPYINTAFPPIHELLEVAKYVLELLPPLYSPGFMLITDGVIEPSFRTSKHLNISGWFVESNVKCSIIQVGANAGFNPMVVLGNVADNEFLRFVAESLSGEFFYSTDLPSFAVHGQINFFHENFLVSKLSLVNSLYKSSIHAVQTGLPRIGDIPREWLNYHPEQPQRNLNNLATSFPWDEYSVSPDVETVVARYREYQMPVGLELSDDNATENVTARKAKTLLFFLDEIHKKDEKLKVLFSSSIIPLTNPAKMNLIMKNNQSHTTNMAIERLETQERFIYRLLSLWIYQKEDWISTLSSFVSVDTIFLSSHLIETFLKSLPYKELNHIGMDLLNQFISDNYLSSKDSIPDNDFSNADTNQKVKIDLMKSCLNFSDGGFSSDVEFIELSNENNLAITFLPDSMRLYLAFPSFVIAQWKFTTNWSMRITHTVFNGISDAQMMVFDILHNKINSFHSKEIMEKITTNQKYSSINEDIPGVSFSIESSGANLINVDGKKFRESEFSINQDCPSSNISSKKSFSTKKLDSIQVFYNDEILAPLYKAERPVHLLLDPSIKYHKDVVQHSLDNDYNKNWIQFASSTHSHKDEWEWVYMNVEDQMNDFPSSNDISVSPTELERAELCQTLFRVAAEVSRNRLQNGYTLLSASEGALKTLSRLNSPNGKNNFHSETGKIPYCSFIDPTDIEGNFQISFYNEVPSDDETLTLSSIKYSITVDLKKLSVHTEIWIEPYFETMVRFLFEEDVNLMVPIVSFLKILNPKRKFELIYPKMMKNIKNKSMFAPISMLTLSRFQLRLLSLPEISNPEIYSNRIIEQDGLLHHDEEIENSDSNEIKVQHSFQANPEPFLESTVPNLKNYIVKKKTDGLFFPDFGIDNSALVNPLASPGNKNNYSVPLSEEPQLSSDVLTDFRNFSNPNLPLDSNIRLSVNGGKNDGDQVIPFTLLTNDIKSKKIVANEPSRHGFRNVTNQVIETDLKNINEKTSNSLLDTTNTYDPCFVLDKNGIPREPVNNNIFDTENNMLHGFHSQKMISDPASPNFSKDLQNSAFHRTYMLEKSYFSDSRTMKKKNSPIRKELTHYLSNELNPLILRYVNNVIYDVDVNKNNKSYENPQVISISNSCSNINNDIKPNSLSLNYPYDSKSLENFSQVLFRLFLEFSLFKYCDSMVISDEKFYQLKFAGKIMQQLPKMDPSVKISTISPTFTVDNPVLDKWYVKRLNNQNSFLFISFPNIITTTGEKEFILTENVPFINNKGKSNQLSTKNKTRSQSLNLESLEQNARDTSIKFYFDNENDESLSETSSSRLKKNSVKWKQDYMSENSDSNEGFSKKFFGIGSSYRSQSMLRYINNQNLQCYTLAFECSLENEEMKRSAVSPFDSSPNLSHGSDFKIRPINIPVSQDLFTNNEEPKKQSSFPDRDHDQITNNSSNILIEDEYKGQGYAFGGCTSKCDKMPEFSDDALTQLGIIEQLYDKSLAQSHFMSLLMGKRFKENRQSIFANSRYIKTDHLKFDVTTFMHSFDIYSNKLLMAGFPIDDFIKERREKLNTFLSESILKDFSILNDHLSENPRNKHIINAPSLGSFNCENVYFCFPNELKKSQIEKLIDFSLNPLLISLECKVSIKGDLLELERQRTSNNGLSGNFCIENGPFPISLIEACKKSGISWSPLFNSFSNSLDVSVVMNVKCSYFENPVDGISLSNNSENFNSYSLNFKPNCLENNEVEEGYFSRKYFKSNNQILKKFPPSQFNSINRLTSSIELHISNETLSYLNSISNKTPQILDSAWSIINISKKLEKFNSDSRTSNFFTDTLDLHLTDILKGIDQLYVNETPHFSGSNPEIKYKSHQYKNFEESLKKFDHVSLIKDDEIFNLFTEKLLSQNFGPYILTKIDKIVLLEIKNLKIQLDPNKLSLFHTKETKIQSSIYNIRNAFNSPINSGHYFSDPMTSGYEFNLPTKHYSNNDFNNFLQSSCAESPGIWFMLKLNRENLKLIISAHVYSLKSSIVKSVIHSLMEKLKILVDSALKATTQQLLLAQLSNTHISSDLLIEPGFETESAFFDDESENYLQNKCSTIFKHIKSSFGFGSEQYSEISTGVIVCDTSKISFHSEPDICESPDIISLVGENKFDRLGFYSCPEKFMAAVPIHSRINPKKLLGSIINSKLGNNSIENRKNMYVFREDNSIFYAKLSIQHLPSFGSSKGHVISSSSTQSQKNTSGYNLRSVQVSNDNISYLIREPFNFRSKNESLKKKPLEYHSNKHIFQEKDIIDRLGLITYTSSNNNENIINTMDTYISDLGKPKFNFKGKILNKRIILRDLIPIKASNEFFGLGNKNLYLLNSDFFPVLYSLTKRSNGSLPIPEMYEPSYMHNHGNIKTFPSSSSNEIPLDRCFNAEFTSQKPKIVPLISSDEPPFSENDLNKKFNNIMVPSSIYSSLDLKPKASNKLALDNESPSLSFSIDYKNNLKLSDFCKSVESEKSTQIISNQTDVFLHQKSYKPRVFTGDSTSNSKMGTEISPKYIQGGLKPYFIVEKPTTIDNKIYEQEFNFSKTESYNLFVSKNKKVDCFSLATDSFGDPRILIKYNHRRNLSGSLLNTVPFSRSNLSESVLDSNVFFKAPLELISRKDINENSEMEPDMFFNRKVSLLESKLTSNLKNSASNKFVYQTDVNIEHPQNASCINSRDGALHNSNSVISRNYLILQLFGLDSPPKKMTDSLVEYISEWVKVNVILPELCLHLGRNSRLVHDDLNFIFNKNNNPLTIYLPVPEFASFTKCNPESVARFSNNKIGKKPPNTKEKWDNSPSLGSSLHNLGGRNNLMVQKNHLKKYKFSNNSNSNQISFIGLLKHNINHVIPSFLKHVSESTFQIFESTINENLLPSLNQNISRKIYNDTVQNMSKFGSFNKKSDSNEGFYANVHDTLLNVSDRAGILYNLNFLYNSIKPLRISEKDSFQLGKGISAIQITPHRPHETENRSFDSENNHSKNISPAMNAPSDGYFCSNKITHLSFTVWSVGQLDTSILLNRIFSVYWESLCEFAMESQISPTLSKSSTSFEFGPNYKEKEDIDSLISFIGEQNISSIPHIKFDSLNLSKGIYSLVDSISSLVSRIIPANLDSSKYTVQGHPPRKIPIYTSSSAFYDLESEFIEKSLHSSNETLKSGPFHIRNNFNETIPSSRFGLSDSRTLSRKKRRTFLSLTLGGKPISSNIQNNMATDQAKTIKRVYNIASCFPLGNVSLNMIQNNKSEALESLDDNSEISLKYYDDQKTSIENQIKDLIKIGLNSIESKSHRHISSSLNSGRYALNPINNSLTSESCQKIRKIFSKNGSKRNSFTSTTFPRSKIRSRAEYYNENWNWKLPHNDFINRFRPVSPTNKSESLMSRDSVKSIKISNTIFNENYPLRASKDFKLEPSPTKSSLLNYTNNANDMDSFIRDIGEFNDHKAVSSSKDGESVLHLKSLASEMELTESSISSYVPGLNHPEYPPEPIPRKTVLGSRKKKNSSTMKEYPKLEFEGLSRLDPKNYNFDDLIVDRKTIKSHTYKNLQYPSKVNDNSYKTKNKLVEKKKRKERYFIPFHGNDEIEDGSLTFPYSSRHITLFFRISQNNLSIVGYNISKKFFSYFCEQIRDIIFYERSRFDLVSLVVSHDLGMYSLTRKSQRNLFHLGNSVDNQNLSWMDINITRDIINHFDFSWRIKHGDQIPYLESYKNSSIFDIFFRINYVYQRLSMNSSIEQYYSLNTFKTDTEDVIESKAGENLLSHFNWARELLYVDYTQPFLETFYIDPLFKLSSRTLRAYDSRLQVTAWINKFNIIADKWQKLYFRNMRKDGGFYKYSFSQKIDAFNPQSFNTFNYKSSLIAENKPSFSIEIPEKKTNSTCKYDLGSENSVFRGKKSLANFNLLNSFSFPMAKKTDSLDNLFINNFGNGLNLDSNFNYRETPNNTKNSRNNLNQLDEIKHADITDLLNNSRVLISICEMFPIIESLQPLSYDVESINKHFVLMSKIMKNVLEEYLRYLKSVGMLKVQIIQRKIPIYEAFDMLKYPKWVSSDVKLGRLPLKPHSKNPSKFYSSKIDPETNSKNFRNSIYNKIYSADTYISDLDDTANVNNLTDELNFSKIKNENFTSSKSNQKNQRSKNSDTKEYTKFHGLKDNNSPKLNIYPYSNVSRFKNIPDVRTNGVKNIKKISIRENSNILSDDFIPSSYTDTSELEDQSSFINHFKPFVAYSSYLLVATSRSFLIVDVKIQPDSILIKMSTIIRYLSSFSAQFPGYTTYRLGKNPLKQYSLELSKIKSLLNIKPFLYDIQIRLIEELLKPIAITPEFLSNHTKPFPMNQKSHILPNNSPSKFSDMKNSPLCSSGEFNAYHLEHNKFEKTSNAVAETEVKIQFNDTLEKNEGALYDKNLYYESIKDTSNNPNTEEMNFIDTKIKKKDFLLKNSYLPPPKNLLESLGIRLDLSKILSILSSIPLYSVKESSRLVIYIDNVFRPLIEDSLHSIDKPVPGSSLNLKSRSSVYSSNELDFQSFDNNTQPSYEEIGGNYLDITDPPKLSNPKNLNSKYPVEIVDYLLLNGYRYGLFRDGITRSNHMTCFRLFSDHSISKSNRGSSVPISKDNFPFPYESKTNVNGYNYSQESFVSKSDKSNIYDSHLMDLQKNNFDNNQNPSCKTVYKIKPDSSLIYDNDIESIEDEIMLSDGSVYKVSFVCLFCNCGLCFNHTSSGYACSNGTRYFVKSSRPSGSNIDSIYQDFNINETKTHNYDSNVPSCLGMHVILKQKDVSSILYSKSSNPKTTRLQKFSRTDTSQLKLESKKNRNIRHSLEDPDPFFDQKLLSQSKNRIKNRLSQSSESIISQDYHNSTMMIKLNMSDWVKKGKFWFENYQNHRDTYTSKIKNDKILSYSKNWSRMFVDKLLNESLQDYLQDSMWGSVSEMLSNPFQGLKPWSVEKDTDFKEYLFEPIPLLSFLETNENLILISKSSNELKKFFKHSHFSSQTINSIINYHGSFYSFRDKNDRNISQSGGYPTTSKQKATINHKVHHIHSNEFQLQSKILSEAANLITTSSKRDSSSIFPSNLSGNKTDSHSKSKSSLENFSNFSSPLHELSNLETKNPIFNAYEGHINQVNQVSNFSNSPNNFFEGKEFSESNFLNIKHC